MTTRPTPSRSESVSVRPLGPLNHAGLLLSALLGVADLVAVVSIPQSFDTTQPGPPAEVLIFSAVMGLVTVVACATAWAGRWRGGSIKIAAVARILSALTSLPAFFVPDVPAGLVAIAGGSVLVTVLAVVLVLVRPRSRA